MLVAVHGATGAQGRPVVRTLLDQGHIVRALSRGRRPRSLPHEVGVAATDLTDVRTLTDAYRDVEAAILVLPGGAPPDLAVLQADTILTALREAGVDRGVFNASGALWSEPPGVPFLDARSRLATGLPTAVRLATVVGPATAYLDNFSEPWLVRHLLATGDLLQTGPADTPLTPVAMADVAAAMAATLREESPPRRVVVHGAATVTGAEVAAGIAAHLQRPVRWTTVPADTYLAGVAGGLGHDYAAAIGSLYGPGAHVPPPDPPPSDTRHVTGELDLTRWIPTQEWS